MTTQKWEDNTAWPEKRISFVSGAIPCIRQYLNAWNSRRYKMLFPLNGVFSHIWSLILCIVTSVCPCDLSGLSAVDLTLNLIRSMKKAARIAPGMERVCRDKLLGANEIRNELFSRRLIDDIKFKTAFFEVLFIAYVNPQVREISSRVTVQGHCEKNSLGIFRPGSCN